MSITTYAELVTALENWLDRTDLSARIPEFISLAEASINRKIRLMQMETTTTGSVSTDTISFPADCLSVSKVQINASNYYILEQMSKDLLIKKYPYSAQGQPYAFCVNGNSIQIRPIPDSTYTYELSYYQQIPDLATNSTNWLLSLYPDIYLYGSLLQAAPYLRDAEETTIWASFYTAAINEAKIADKTNRWGGGSLAMVAL